MPGCMAIKRSTLVDRKYSKMREMKKLVVSVIIIGILLWKCTDGCLDYERNALMELKNSFHLPRDYMVGEDCCQWDTVVCNSSTGRVTELSISCYYIDQSEYNYYFNASLFLPFHQLNTLNITFTNIAGCVHNQCFERLSELKKLESFDLTGNNFKNRSILSSIADISSLRSLVLSDIGLEGTDKIQWLSKLKKLEDLDLSYNNFNNPKLLSLPVISSLKILSLKHCGLEGTVDIEGLSKLGKLEDLDLSNNNFSNTKLLSLPASLKTLSLVDCGLKGTIDIEGLSKLGNLEDLDLSFNNFSNTKLLSLPASLKTLSLIDCGLKGTIDIQGLSKLEKLESLDLSSNNFNDTKLLFPFIQELMGSGTSLKNLKLAWNEIESFGGGCAEFKKFDNLELLDLSYNYLDNSILSSLNHCFSLKYLYIDNSLQGSMNLEELDALANLEVLSLQQNQIDRIVGSRGLCKLRHLEKLDISYNEISGTLPWCIANLTSLKKLDLSWNYFNGSISPLRSLTSLQALKFPGNQFQVPISLDPFFNHSKLKYLDAWSNSQIYNDEEIDVHNFIPKFQLETLLLSSPGKGGAFPKFLYHQHDLREVDLSNIKLKGEFPYWLLVNNTKLSSLSLANTSLSGPFQLSNNSSKYLLKKLDISDNKFNGTIPTNIGQVLPNLQFLNLSENGFTGSIPSSFGKMSSLVDLDMSYNWLSGEVPEDLYLRCSLLYRVILSHNNFEGQILPKQVNYLKGLVYLLLDGNKFTGNIPNSLLNCTNDLSILDVSNNHLTGIIPGWIANMSHLQVLDLSNNSFSKKLSSHFCPYAIKEVYLSNNQLQGSLGNVFYNCSELIILDLSHNHLTGTIPKWIGNLTNLSYILFSFNQLQGPLPIELCNLSQLCLVDLSNNNLSSSVLSCLKFSSKHVQSGFIYGINYMTPHMSPSVPDMQRPLGFTTKGITYEFRGSILKLISGIDFSCNNFIGEIPGEIGNLSNIKALNLSHNSLTGPIPQSLANLTQIESLDLSYNNLNGKIPPQLTQLHFVSNFNVAHNNLSGKIPEMVGQFATFDKSSYEGNPFLCGPPLLESCQADDSPTNSIEEEEERGFIYMNDFYVSFLISYVIVLLSIAAVLYINPYWRRAWFYFIEVSLRNCYYFMEDTIIALRKLGAS